MWYLHWQAINQFRSSIEYFLLRRLHDAIDLLHFNFAAGIYRQARSRSSHQEYSPISLSWKCCKITRVSFILLFEDRIVYSYPPEGFKRRTLHVPNIIIRFGTCKVRRMNQLGTALLYLGRSIRQAQSIRLSLSNRTAKDRLRFIRRTSQVTNLMHKLC